MTFVDTALAGPRPASLDAIALPRRQSTFPSPVDWRDEVLYFLLVDRFSDAGEADRPLLDRGNLAAARPNAPGGQPWTWQAWSLSGGSRWQGGTLNGVRSKLGYLRDLGVSTLWLSPVFKQRGHLDTYHGYGVQDFLDVDARFGTRRDLVELTAAAHQHGMRILLDVIFNHSGSNWIYPEGTPGGRHKARYTSARYGFGAWRDRDGRAAPLLQDAESGVWPAELQDTDAYTRAGSGSLDHAPQNLDDPAAEHKRTDFEDLRDFDVDRRLAGRGTVLAALADCYKYWIALTDCDGFRIDTLKHVTPEQARNFCGAIKEFAANLGKTNFFLLGEIAGGDLNEDHYLDVAERNLNAALDIGEMRLALTPLAKGLTHPDEYFRGFDPGRAVMGSHRNLGNRHVSILDDHDHVWGPKLRFSAEASSTHQVIAGVAIQLFTLGIPCIYYGTEQALGGPEASERQWLPEWGGNDRYLREAMFGPEHPKKPGREGLGNDAIDPVLPGFGAFGTAGRHCFDRGHGAFRRIAALAAVRRAFPVLRHGRQYLRPTSLFGWPFEVRGGGELLAWSRILDDEEALCVVNVNGGAARGADVLVDVGLNAAADASFEVVANTAQAGGTADAAHPVGSAVPVRHAAGNAFVEIRDVAPSEVLVLVNRP